VKVYVFPADETGCGAYRMIWPSRALAATGHNVQVVSEAEVSGFLSAEIIGARLNQAGKIVGGRAQKVHVPEDTDVVVFQRPLNRYLADSVQILRDQGVAVVVEMDDDLAAIHPRHIAVNKFNPRFSSEYNWDHCQRACDAATLVTATTQPLLDRYASHGRGVLIPNYAPDHLLDVPHEDSAQVGWGGSVFTHPDDAQVVGDAIGRLFTTAGQFLRIVGPGPDEVVAREFGVKARQVRCTGPVPIDEYAGTLAAEIGVGIAPLQHNPFNRSKSWLKALEYSALGIPWVASGLDEYRAFYAATGGGLIAESPKQWHQHLRRLTRSSALRLELGAAGRQAVRERFTISGNARLWWSAWEHAYQLQGRGVGVG